MAKRNSSPCTPSTPRTPSTPGTTPSDSPLASAEILRPQEQFFSLAEIPEMVRGCERRTAAHGRGALLGLENSASGFLPDPLAQVAFALILIRGVVTSKDVTRGELMLLSAASAGAALSAELREEILRIPPPLLLALGTSGNKELAQVIEELLPSFPSNHEVRPKLIKAIQEHPFPLFDTYRNLRTIYPDYLEGFVMNPPEVKLLSALLRRAFAADTVDLRDSQVLQPLLLELFGDLTPALSSQRGAKGANTAPVRKKAR